MAGASGPRIATSWCAWPPAWWRRSAAMCAMPSRCRVFATDAAGRLLPRPRGRAALLRRLREPPGAAAALRAATTSQWGTAIVTDLFSPFTLRGVTLRNRIGVAPMCQYCCAAGRAADRLAPRAPGLARGGRGGADHRGSDGGDGGGAHQPRRPRHLERGACRAACAPGRGDRGGGLGAGHPDRPCRAQGIAHAGLAARTRAIRPGPASRPRPRPSATSPRRAR